MDQTAVLLYGLRLEYVHSSLALVHVVKDD